MLSYLMIVFKRIASLEKVKVLHLSPSGQKKRSYAFTHPVSLSKC